MVSDFKEDHRKEFEEYLNTFDGLGRRIAALLKFPMSTLSPLSMIIDKAHVRQLSLQVLGSLAAEFSTAEKTGPPVDDKLA